MNCYEVREKLGPFLDKELPENESFELKRHLERCEACAQEARLTRRLESLVGQGLYQLPPDEYWSELPGIITRRIGAQPKTSWTQLVLQRMTDLMSVRSVQYGFAMAAVMLMIFLTRQRPIEPETGHTRVDVAQTVQPSSQVSVPQQPRHKLAEDSSRPVQMADGEPSLDTSPAPTASVPALPHTRQQISGPSAEAATQGRPRPVSESWVPRLTPVKGLRKGSQYSPRVYAQRELIPVPNSLFVLAEDEESTVNADEALLIPEPAALARGVEPVGGQQRGFGHSDTARAESDFSETMLIVQQSGSLAEKRNIWLSYIHREQDVTYRSLAIYRLALVLAKLARQEGTPRAVKEAREFFLQHEETLRFQMRDRIYENRLNILNMLLNE